MIEDLPMKLMPGRERANWIYKRLSTKFDEGELEHALKQIAKYDPETFCTLIADQLNSDFSNN